MARHLVTPTPEPVCCPTCGRRCTPVYCAVSTPEQPLLLAYTVAQAAAALGMTTQSLYRHHLIPWRGGYRLRPYRRKEDAA